MHSIVNLQCVFSFYNAFTMHLQYLYAFTLQHLQCSLCNCTMAFTVMLLLHCKLIVNFTMVLQWHHCIIYSGFTMYNESCSTLHAPLQAVQAVQAVQPGEGARREALAPRRAPESLQAEAVCSRGKSSATSCHLDFNIIIISSR